MLHAVWLNPEDEATILACADWLVEEFGWGYEEALIHARYHARRSLQYRRS